METLAYLLGEGIEPMAWWQMCLRAVVLFIWGLFLIRIGGKRMFGKAAAFDIVLTVVLGSVLSRVITGDTRLVPGMAATAILVALHWVMAWLAWRMPLFGRIVKGRGVRLVQAGCIDWREMRRNGITRHDLDEALRSHGLGEVGQAECVFIERNGEITVIRR